MNRQRPSARAFVAPAVSSLRPASRRAAPWIAIGLSLGLAACTTTNSIDTNELADALNVASSALGVASAVSGANSGGGATAAPLRPGTGQVPKPSGYSQRGAFEDCEKTYRAAGMNDLAAKCAARATNMNSLRP